MSSIRKTALLGIALFVTGTAQAGSIVVRSSGTKAYPTGKVLADNVKISLKAGESVTILDGKGTRQLNGPGMFSTVVGGGAAQEARVKNILSNSGTRVARTGAIRGTGTASKPASIWHADVSKSGTICIANPDRFSAWRANTAKAASYTVTRVSDGKSAPLIFGETRAQTPWPSAELPAVNGASYKITGDGIVNPIVVRFALMNSQPTGLESTVSEMMGKGCTAQYEMLIDMVSTMDDGSGQPTG